MGCRQNRRSNLPCLSPVRARIDSSSSVDVTSTFPSNEEREKFRQFIHLLGELHRRCNQCERIQQGSPGAGSFSSTIDSVKGQLKEVEVESIITRYANLFFMMRLKKQHESFNEV